MFLTSKLKGKGNDNNIPLDYIKPALPDIEEIKKLSISDELREFAIQFETKIKSTIKSGYNTKNPLNHTFIQQINDVLNKDKVTEILDTNVSLNNAVRYLVEKEQINLVQNSEKKVACFVDGYNIEWLKANKNSIDTSNMIFYLQAKDRDEKLFDDFQRIFIDKRVQSSFIKPLAKENYRFPDAKTIANTIQAFVEYKYPTNSQKQTELTQAICKYLNECTIPFSYQTLAQKTQEQYKLIEQEVIKRGKTMDDVFFVIPRKNKSYDIINYIFAVENKLKSSNFLDRVQAHGKICEPNGTDKIYAIVDDFCGSGDSFCEISHYFPDLEDKASPLNIIFSPIVGTSSGKAKITQKQTEKINTNYTYLPLINYSELGYVNTATHKFWKQFCDKDLNEFYKGFEKLSKEDIEFLKENLLGGCDKTYSSVFFPYMVPDNSSDISTLLGGNFLNIDSKKGNKGIDAGTIEQISREDYEKLKKIIQLQ